jgi:hypothetical protein
MLAGMTAFGQGYLSFTAGKSQVWTGGLPGGGVISTLNVSFLWGTANVASAAATLAGSTISATSIPRTNLVAWGEADPNAAMWTAILTDVNFTLAKNNTTGNAVMQPVIANGGFTYGNVPLQGSTAGTTVYAYEIAWTGGFATPALAQTGAASVGWGNVFSYTLTASTAGAGTITGASQFGVGKWAPIPEPTTIALAGLGALSLLAFRRRK